MFKEAGERSFFWEMGVLGKTVAWALIVGLLLCGRVAAQSYEVDSTRITDRVAKAAYSQVISPSLRDLQVFNQNKAKFDVYFKKYYFPRMTNAKQSDLVGLAKRRENLFKQYIRRTEIEEVQTHLTSLIMPAMGKHALGNYHPAVRYNAVLILGMLDQRYSSGAQPPIPLPACTRVLLILLENESVKEVKIPASLKLGALKGLERHVRFGIDAQYAEQLTKALLKLLAQQQPPEEVTKEVHHWIQCQAARVLVRQFAKGPSGEVQDALTTMIGNGDIGLDDRCCVAGLLGKMDYQGAKKINATAARLALGVLAQAVFQEEVSPAEDFQEEIVKGQNFGGGGRSERISRPGGKGNVGPQYERRRIMARLQGIQEGGKALGAALPDEEVQQLQKLLTHINTLMTLAGKKDSDDILVTGSVLELVRKIDRVVASWKVAKKPAKAVEEDFS